MVVVALGEPSCPVTTWAGAEVAKKVMPASRRPKGFLLNMSESPVMQRSETPLKLPRCDGTEMSTANKPSHEVKESQGHSGRSSSSLI
jgi:hypothetical protein